MLQGPDVAATLNGLTVLRELSLYKCFRLTSLPSLDELSKLQKLYLGDCSRLKSLHPSTG